MHFQAWIDIKIDKLRTVFWCKSRKQDGDVVPMQQKQNGSVAKLWGRESPQRGVAGLWVHFQAEHSNFKEKSVENGGSERNWEDTIETGAGEEGEST